MTITHLTDGINKRRYRIVGAPESSKWTVRPGQEPWCEVSLSADGTVLTYGGELWPSAWPSLFTVGPRTIYGQLTTVTAKFLDMIGGQL